MRFIPRKFIVLLALLLGVSLASPALADQWADGNKNWGTGSSVVHALKARFPVANSMVRSTDNYLYHNLVGVIDWNAWYIVDIGYLTDNGGWLVGSRRNFYYHYKLPGVDKLTTLWDPGAPGSMHTFYLMWDNSAQQYKFTIDASTWWSPTTSAVGFTDAYAGIHISPSNADASSVSTRFDLFDWASISQWYWHGNWPTPTFLYDLAGGPGASGLPENGYTDAWY